MKKSRPALTVSVLCDVSKQSPIEKTLWFHSSTFGLRSYKVTRSLLPRKTMKIKTRYGEVSLKCGYLNGRMVKSKPEYEDCKKLARARVFRYRMFMKASVSQKGEKMNADELRILLENIREGKLTVEDGFAQLRNIPYRELDCAKIDTHREMRVGYPEVVFCPGKTIEQITKIVRAMMEGESNILVTRAGKDIFAAVREICPDAFYNPLGRTIALIRKKAPASDHYIAVVTAGTADLPVAEEAAVTAEVFGNRVERIVDVGVAGIHRLFDRLDLIRNARVIIVVAGMEGALPSVIGGLVDKPIIAVPTSVGYGTHFQGLAALLAMLNSCAGGIMVVNIDNGFGAGCAASKINKLK